MMKIVSLFTTLAVVCGATYAAECTTSQLQAAAQLPEMAKFESACAGISFSGASSTATVKKVCENKVCLDAMKAVFNAFPKCEVQGLSLSDTLASVDTACQYVGAGSTTSSSKVASTQTPTTSAASSSVTGATTTAIAAVAAVYTYARA